MSDLITAERSLVDDYSSAAKYLIEVNAITVATKLRETLAALRTVEGVLLEGDRARSFFSALKDVADKLEDAHLEIGETVADTVKNISDVTGHSPERSEQLAITMHRAIQKAYENEGEKELKIEGSANNRPVYIIR